MYFYRGIHIIQTHMLTHTGFCFRLPVCHFLMPHPPYSLAFPPLTDALSKSTNLFWGDILCTKDKLWHYIKQGNGKVKQTEQHYYSTNKWAYQTHPFWPFLSSAVLFCPLCEPRRLICQQTETWYQCLQDCGQTTLKSQIFSRYSSVKK